MHCMLHACNSWKLALFNCRTTLTNVAKLRDSTVTLLNRAVPARAGVLAPHRQCCRGFVATPCLNFNRQAIHAILSVPHL